MIPEQLRYTAEHEWVRVGGDGPAVRIGVTHFAQESLGDIVFVDLPEPGAKVTGGEPLGEVESTKSVSEVYAPLSGTVTGRNEALADQPELINSDPYGEGWLVEIEPEDAEVLGGLLDAAAYRELIDRS